MTWFLSLSWGAYLWIAGGLFLLLIIFDALRAHVRQVRRKTRTRR